MNELARRARHQKVFSKISVLKLPRLVSLSNIFVQPARTAKKFLRFSAVEESTVSVSNKLFKRYTAAVAVLFFIGSITPTNSLAYDSYGVQDSYPLEAGKISLLSDDEGYLTKINPQTNSGDRSTMHDRLTHTVAAGETVSTIAAVYGLKTSTVLWENGIVNANSLRVGQKLSIPPVDGITHQVTKDQTLEKIAKTYGVTAEAIQKQNGLLVSTVTVGQELFIPGAKPLAPADDGRTTPSRIGTSSRVYTASTEGAILENSNDVPVGDKPFIFPTRGKLTQGFHAGHYAFDIGDRSMPPVWAAGSGTVIKAVTGCGSFQYNCGGGYGNHVVIDHGNGLQTLYGHLDHLDVAKGDYVEQGQTLGQMGNTGRVRGATGIHLHFEVSLNGKKKLPSDYY